MYCFTRISPTHFEGGYETASENSPAMDAVERHISRFQGRVENVEMCIAKTVDLSFGYRRRSVLQR